MLPQVARHNFCRACDNSNFSAHYLLILALILVGVISSDDQVHSQQVPFLTHDYVVLLGKNPALDQASYRLLHALQSLFCASLLKINVNQPPILLCFLHSHSLRLFRLMSMQT